MEEIAPAGEPVSWVVCPECGSPAAVTDHAQLASTDGPLVLGRVHCVRRHWFHMPVDDLVPWPALEPADGLGRTA
jgi:hypothetical protein